MRKDLNKYLSKFTSNMKTASESGYTRNISKRDRIKLLEAYRELTTDPSPKLILCHSCIVEILKELHKYYTNEIKSTSRPSSSEPMSVKADADGDVIPLPSLLP